MQASDFAPIHPNPQIQAGLEAMRARMPQTSMPEIKRFDIVRLANGDQMIVTDIKPSRPANPFLGILVNGQGAEYKFGPRFRPVVIGKADQSHPALVALRGRKGVNASSVYVIRDLLNAVEDGNMQQAKILASVIRKFEGFQK